MAAGGLWISRTLLLNILSLSWSRTLGDGLGEEAHELAIAGIRSQYNNPVRGRAPTGWEGGHRLVAGEARVGAQLLLSDNLVGGLGVVADDLPRPNKGGSERRCER